MACAKPSKYFQEMKLGLPREDANMVLCRRHGLDAADFPPSPPVSGASGGPRDTPSISDWKLMNTICGEKVHCCAAQNWSLNMFVPGSSHKNRLGAVFTWIPAVPGGGRSTTVQVSPWQIRF